MHDPRGESVIERWFARVQAYAQDLAGGFAITIAGLIPRGYQTRLLKDDYGSIERDPNAERSRESVVPFHRPGDSDIPLTGASDADFALHHDSESDMEKHA